MASRNVDALRQLAAQFAAEGLQAEALQFDQSSEASIQETFSADQSRGTR